jgi:hypothetical protein
VTTIRSTPFPPPGYQPPVRDDAGKAAAQRAFFAAVSSQAQPAATAPTDVARPAPAQTVSRVADAPAESPQRILRPGSLFDIRV